jgi:hypothetical protein
VDDSTLAATLPATENGALQLWERIDGEDVDRGLLQVYGFIRAATISMPIEAEFTPSRNPALPYVITGDSAGVSVIDLRNDLVTRYPGIGRLRYEGSGCHRIAGPTYQDGTFLIWDTVQTFPRQGTRWQLIPDTLRQEALFPFGCGMAEVSPRVFVHTGSEGVGAFASLDSIDTAGNITHFFSDTVIGNKGFIWSGNRMVLKGLNHQGTGVIDLKNRGLAYRVPLIKDVWSAAFSADGQSLFLCGQQSSPFQNSLLSVNTATGDSIKGVLLDCPALASDSDLGLLYALVRDSFPSVSVAVMDPATLLQVGKIDLPSDACFYCVDISAMVVDRANLELVVVYYTLPQGVGLAHLSLPPAFLTARQ